MFIKIINNQGQKRQVKRSPKNFSDLKKLTAQIWGKEAEIQNIAYLDSEDELITIINDEDWEVCMEELNLMSEESGQKVKKLTLRLVPMDEDDLNALRGFDSSSDDGGLETERVLLSKENSVNETPKEEETKEFKQDKIDLLELLQDGLDHLKDWKITPNPAPGLEVITKEIPNGQENIFEEKVEETKKEDQLTKDIDIETPVITEQVTKEPEVKKEEEKQIFEENHHETAPNPFSNTIEQLNSITNPPRQNEDVLIDLNLQGTNLKDLKAHIHKIAPFLGFEVEKAEIIETPPKSESKNLGDITPLETEVSVTSQLTNDMRDEISQMIKSQVKKELSENNSEKNFKKSENSEEFIHHGFTCDGCNAYPIIGTRYHSLSKKNFDLCEKCEKTMCLEDPMLRIRKPKYQKLGHSGKWHAISGILKSFDKKEDCHVQNNDRRQRCRGMRRKAFKNFKKQMRDIKKEVKKNINFSKIENKEEFKKNPFGFFFNTIKDVINEAQIPKPPAPPAPKPEEKEEVKKTEESKKEIPEVEKNAFKLCHIRKSATQPIQNIRMNKVKNLCHIRRQRQPLIQKPENPDHPRLNEFSKVFTHARKCDINKFLEENKNCGDDNELYNRAIEKFLN